MERTPLQPPPPKPAPPSPIRRDAAGNGADFAGRQGNGKPPAHDPNLQHAIQPPPPDHDEIDLNVPRPRNAWVILGGIVAFLALAALVAIGFFPRNERQHELEADARAAAEAPLMVNVARPRRAAATTEMRIPGTLRPWQEVSIFARTTGYLKKYYVDISNQVEAGQLMAEIDSPEINQELMQDQAALLQVKAAVNKAITDRDLAKVTLDRFKQLLETKSATPQQLDEKQAGLNAAEAALESAKANVAAAEATVRRLTELQSFERISAPFAGVVTGRAYDVGSFIVGNPTAADVKPMFKIAENDVLRAFVNVPQSSALTIRKGMEVKVEVRERAGEIYTGQVMGTTNYLDAASRSLLTEIKVLNVKRPDGEFSLLPGMFVSARFSITRDAPPLLIPAPSIIAGPEGNVVALVKNNAIHLQKVTVGQDFGSDIEITGGLEGNELVVANPGERVVEGAPVQPGLEQTLPAAKATVATERAPSNPPMTQPASPAPKPTATAEQSTAPADRKVADAAAR